MAETNYDRIKNRSIDEMAEYIYLRDDELADRICKECESRSGGCRYGDTVTSENCIACIKRWLEAEATE